MHFWPIVQPCFSCNRYLIPLSRNSILHSVYVTKPIKMISFNLLCTGCRQSGVLGCKSELPSYPAEVAGLKNCEEVRTYSIPLVISSEKQLNTFIKQTFKTFDVDVAPTQFLAKIITGGEKYFVSADDFTASVGG